jgi:four helix bundle protein
VKTTRFEDIEAWRASRRLSRQIYTITVSEGLRRNSELKSQIRGAANSVMTNIEEGVRAGSDSEFARFLRIAQRSATEVQSHLHFALDHGHITRDEFVWLDGSAEDVKRVIGGFVRSLSAPAPDSLPDTPTED